MMTTGKSPSPKLKVQVWIYLSSPSTNTPLFLLLLTCPQRGEFWQPVTGGVNPQESLLQAALREAKEETGLCFDEMPQPIGEPFHYRGKEGQAIEEYAFYLKASFQQQDNPPPVQLDPYEHIQYAWSSAEEVFKKVKYESNRKIFSLLSDYLQCST